eukprot:316418_1
MTEFRINCNQNPLTYKISLNLFSDFLSASALRNDLIIFDPKHIDDFPDGVVYRNMRANCTADMNNIYLGQICDLYLNKQSLYSGNSIPFDPLYDKYYSRNVNKNYKFIDSKQNFSYNKSDCFQYVYDWGEEFVYNIYVIDKTKNYDTNFFSQFINGRGMCPPNDIGGMEQFKWAVETCHYNPNVAGREVSLTDLKTPNDIYQWMINHEKIYYKYACLMDKNRVRNELICNLQNNYRIDKSVRKKIINRLKSNKAFWFPYRILPNVQDYMDVLCTKYIRCWDNKLRKYTKRQQKCCYCGNETWKLKRCRRCKCAIYCSRKCQKKDWISHKKNCHLT